MPGRFGRLHASLPLRRNAGPIWPLPESPTCGDTRARPVAGPARATRTPSRQRTRTAARASESTPSRPLRVGTTRQVDASEVAHHDPTHMDHDALERRHCASRSDPAQLPRLRLTSPPLYLRTSDRFPGSFFMVLMLLPVPFRLAAAPPPAFHLHAWADLPGVCLQVEEGGSSAKRWTPLPRKPRRKAKKGPEAGRRPVDLQGSTTRDQHQEVGPRTRRVHMRARSVGSVVRLGSSALGAS